MTLSNRPTTFRPFAEVQILISRVAPLILLVGCTAPFSLTAQIVGTLSRSGFQPTAVAVYEAGNRVFAADKGSHKVIVFDGLTNTEIGSIPYVPDYVDQLLVDEATGKAYFSDGPDKIAVIDAKQGTFLRDISIPRTVGITPNFMAQDPGLGHIYIINGAGFTRIKAATDSVDSVPLSIFNIYSFFTVNPVTHEIFVATYNNSNLFIANGVTLQTSQIPGFQGGPIAVGIDWVSNKVFVHLNNTNEVVIFNRNTNAVVKKVFDFGDDPTIFVWDPKTRRMYSSMEVSGKALVCDGASDTCSEFDPTPYFRFGTYSGGAVGVKVRYDTGHIYYASPTFLAILDASSGVFRLLTNSDNNEGGIGWVGIAINQSNGRVYVFNRMNDSIGPVTVIDDSPKCSYRLSSLGIAPAGIAAGQLVVTPAPSTCPITVSTSAPEVSTSVSGNTVTYSTTSRFSNIPEVSTIGIGSQAFPVFTIAIEYGGCTYTLSQEAMAVGSGLSSGSYTVKGSLGGPAYCEFFPVSSVEWITVTSSIGGTQNTKDNAIVTFQVAPNPGPQRSGTITAMGTIFTLTQTGSGGGAMPLSLTPAVSTGSTQTLTLTVDAPGGYQALDVVNMLINTALDGHQGCYLAYSRTANALYIVADNGDSTQITGKVMDGTGTVGNSQCTVTLAGSSATGNGNALTLVLNVSFSPSFAGNKVIYAAARDLSQNTAGWQTMGVHGIPPLPSTFPNPVGMSPSSGTALSQTITFTYQGQSTAANLQTVWALINTAIDGRAACYVAYYRPGNQLYLYPDNGDGSQATNIVLSGNNTIGNSQCTISAQGASVQISGNTLAVTLPITFKAAFAGFKGVWLAAQTLGGAQTSPWQALGVEVVPAQ